MIRTLILLTLLFSTLTGGCSPPAARETYIECEDAKIYCRTIGKGKPLIVVHGGPGLGHDHLLPYLDRLAEHNFVIFYDQRGCGRSNGEIREDTMTVPTLVRELDTLREEFGFDKVSLLGHSWGGLLAMHYAIEHPERVEKLILSNAEPGSSEGTARFLEEYVKRTSPYKEEMAAIEATEDFRKGDPDLYERFYLLMIRTYCHVPNHANLLNLRMSRSAAINSMKICQMFWTNTLGKPYDLHDSLRKLQIPTLILHGDDDIVPLSTAEKLHQSICHSQFVILKDCGHFPYVEQPEEYFKALRKFLLDTGGRIRS